MAQQPGMRNLRLIELGASTAYANTISETFERRKIRRSAYFEHGSFIDSAYNPLIVAFQNPEHLSVFFDRICQLRDEALSDFVNRAKTNQLMFKAQEIDVYICLPSISNAQGITEEILNLITKNTSEKCQQVLEKELEVRVCNVNRLSHAQPSTGLLFKKYFNHELQVGTRPFVVIAVDSFNDAERLNYFNENAKLFSNTHRYGFVPG